MASTAQDTRSPVATPREPSPTRLSRRPPLLGWVAAVAALAAAAALAVVTLTGDSDERPIGQPLIAEHGSIRSIEGSVEDTIDPPASSQGHAGIVEHGSIRAHEGSVEDAVEQRDADALRLEHQAHLDGQARTYGGTAGS
jgi:hypothetical protein